MQYLRRIGVLAASAAVAIALSTGAAQANPPSLSDVVTDTTLSATTFVPGQQVHATWHFNTAYAPQVTAVQLWLAHSTGMGHAPNTLIKTSVDPKSGAVDFTVPNVTPSKPGNIWIFDIVWLNGNGQQTELSLTNVTVA
ncbi:hypothetical protein [Kutzneria sp. 744]|uniref:hypothetical protein n=1 Tax=Kutzneria sp. (strain 744) TaxID=345341 RepID=UPI0003EEE212|nr:hypothetical protein [Kutzneria sp. 744]EWM19519.1 hypothetical protein KUTG_09823 [Kutzneria sp. 744]